MLGKRWARWLLVAGGVVAASALIAACGGDADEEAPAPAADGEEIVTFTLQSEAFQNGAGIPARYTCDGDDLSPPLSWSDAPDGSEAFALIVDDPDAPGGTFTHWVLYDLPPGESRLPEGVAKDDRPDVGGSQGVNDFGDLGYGGPCPPPNGPHRYQFTLYALNGTLDLPPGATKDRVLDATQGRVVGRAELTGAYGR